MRNQTRLYSWQVLLLVVPFLLFIRSASAQPVPTDPKAQALFRNALAALQKNDLLLAERTIENCYLREPTAALYEIMGKIAQQRGNTTTAADFYRRFLEEYPDPTLNRSALHKLIEQVLPFSAEIDVSGESGSLLRIDNRLTGRLPLSRAILIAPGKHLLTMEAGGKSTAYSVDATAGIPIGIRFVPDSAHVAIETRPPVVLVTYDGQVKPNSASLAIARAIGAGIRQDGQAHALAVERLLGALGGQRKDCLMSERCLSDLANKLGAQGVVTFVSEPTVQIGYIDAKMGYRSDSTVIDCTACTVESQAQRISEATRVLITRVVGRAYGMLALSVNPSGARVELLPSAKSYTAPAQIQLLSGVSTILLTKDGFLPLRAQIEIPVDGTRTIQLALRPNAAAQTQRKVHAAKWFLISAGVLSSVGGIIGIALDGKFERDVTTVGPNGETREVFQSLPQGVSALSAGLAAIAGGVWLATYERKLERQARRDEEDALSKSP